MTIDPGTDDIPLAAVVARAAAAAEKPAKSKEALLRAAVVLVPRGVVRAEDEVKTAITKVGEAAAKKNIRIHTLGYSPSEDGQYHPVRPLLALGELSRRSLGTFRWIKTMI